MASKKDQDLPVNNPDLTPATGGALAWWLVPFLLVWIVLQVMGSDFLITLFCLGGCEETSVSVRDAELMTTLLLAAGGIFSLSIMAYKKKLRDTELWTGVAVLLVGALYGVLYVGASSPTNLVWADISIGLYALLVAVTLLIYPFALIRGYTNSVYHFLQVFGIAMICSLVIGHIVLLCVEVIWTIAVEGRSFGARKFVIPPSTVVITGSTWSAIMLYPQLFDDEWAAHRCSMSLWIAPLAVASLLFAFLYGPLFLSSKSWVTEAHRVIDIAGYSGGLLLAGIVGSTISTVFIGKGHAYITSLTIGCVLAGVIGGTTAFVLLSPLSNPIGGESTLIGVDRWVFVLSHTLAAVAIPLTVAIIARIVRSRPWYRPQTKDNSI